MPSLRLLPVVLLSLLLGLAPQAAGAQVEDSIETPLRRSGALSPQDSFDTDVPFVRTPKNIVVRMLELAEVTENDIVYDLGSGDGRIPITAAQQFGARGVGIEIKPDLVQKARHRARVAGVEDKVEFRQGDLFEADFSDATVVTLYLLPDVNTQLRPLLFEQLKPGTRVVSHAFDMNGWEPDRSVEVNGSYLYLWTIPEDVPDHLR